MQIISINEVNLMNSKLYLNYMNELLSAYSIYNSIERINLLFYKFPNL